MAAPAEVVGTGRGALVDRLAEEMGGVLPRTVVEAEVAAAERELDGQVPAGALEEMLHRLVVYRLMLRASGSP